MGVRPHAICSGSTTLDPGVRIKYLAKWADEVKTGREIVQSDAAPRTVDCVFRGIVVRQGEADLCGRKGELFDVFACQLHGECVIGRFCQKQKELSCLRCSDIKANEVVE